MIKRSRILLADDHTLLLEAFRRMLEPDFEVVGCVTNGRDLVERAGVLDPDVVVADISMPVMNGFEACVRIKQASPRTAVVLLTVNAEPHVAAEAFEAGASAYLLKSATADELTVAICAALEGRRFLSRAIAGGDPEALPKRAGMSPWARLSPREREVVQLLAEGYSMEQVAAILGIATRMVELHKNRAMEALGVKTGADLVRVALQHKLP